MFPIDGTHKIVECSNILVTDNILEVSIVTSDLYQVGKYIDNEIHLQPLFYNMGNIADLYQD